MSSPWMVRRARSSDGAFRAATFGAALRVALALRIPAARRAFATPAALPAPAFLAPPALRALPAPDFRATAFLAPARLFFAAVFRAAVFRAVRAVGLVLRACFLVAEALRLAIAVVLSVPAYLDCFRVSVVESSAYRRRKQLTDKLHPT